MPVLEVLPLIEDIRVSRVKGKTVFEMAETEPTLNYICDFYLNIADQLLSHPEGVIPMELEDRELFNLLSTFYLNGSSPVNEKTTNFSTNLSEKTEKTNDLDFLLV